MINKNMKKKIGTGCALIIVAAMVLSGCKSSSSLSGSSATSTSSTASVSADASLSASVDISELSATIELSDGSTTFVGSGVELKDDDVIITAGGTYSFSGSLSDGRIKVEAGDEEVIIILNGVQITNTEGDAIYIEEAGNAVVYVMESTENVLTSGVKSADADKEDSSTESDESENSEQTADDTEADSEQSDTGEETTETDEGFSNSQKAVIMAKCDLTVTGSGNLTVYGYINNGVQSKEILTLDSVNLTVDTVNDGIKAGSALVVNSGTYTIEADGDAIQSDGTLDIENGDFTIVTGDGAASVERKSDEMGGGMGPGGQGGGRPGQGGDQQTPPDNAGDPQQNGQQTPPDMMSGENGAEDMPDMSNMPNFGDMESSSDLDDENSVSQKGIKADGQITINGGTFSFDTADDAIHGGAEVVINDGSFNIEAGDDGVHSDTELTINGGVISVTDCYEGIEGATITINGGDISVTSDDDGINASSDLVDPEIIINGGKVYIDTSGDGIDSNKNITINGGEVYVDGPGNAGNAAIDVGSENQGVFAITGGTITSLGMSGMLENPSETSTQQSITYVFDETLEAGSVITITDSDGKEIATITTARSADSITYSSAELESGKTYTISSGDLTGTITTDKINASNYAGRTH
ncbi:carbohydrate-binding domain-containing protein [Butyrivibrio proteoclasticus]|uniref:carbohydrate-binding domain-containing protein n=1 Tax=Butyrivibrio proteoclasticus TaxID=43305 RepID=UPI000479587A|nr:carbohydrate-binding domain-containing protein [Butyrivibrio proteoclasticus]